MKVVSVERMRAIEAAADASGISYDTMMQSAGNTIAQRILSIVEPLSEPKITLLIGPGNNGGDGLVASVAISQQSDAQVRLYLLKRRQEDDPLMKAAEDAGLFIAYFEDDADYRVLRNMVASADVVIDALFGIGARLPMRDDAEKVLRAANQAINERQNYFPDNIPFIPANPDSILDIPRQYIVAVDCPSGLDCDTGEIDKNAIRADETITFIAAKQGQFMFPGAEYVGELIVSQIGIPESLDELKAEKTTLVDAQYVADALPDRTVNSHKGTFGKALIAAGSINYIGAAGLSTEAAYRSGAGLVTLAAPQPVLAMVAARLAEPTWMLLPHDMGVIAEGAVKVIREKLDDYQSLLIGPGIGREKTTHEFLEQLLQESTETVTRPKRSLGFGGTNTKDEEESDESSSHELPSLIIDADGLNLLSEIEAWWKHLPEKTIITPHVGEIARLAQMENDEVVQNRWQIAREKAVEWNVIVLLKGAHTLIAAPDGELAVLPFKSDALATAGTGDVLAGLIVGLLAQGSEPFKAAVTGAYIHGLAGQIAANQSHARSVVASDVLASIGLAFRSIGDKLG